MILLIAAGSTMAGVIASIFEPATILIVTLAAAGLLVSRLPSVWSCGFTAVLGLLIAGESKRLPEPLPVTTPFIAAALLLALTVVMAGRGAWRCAPSGLRAYAFLVGGFVLYGVASAAWSVDAGVTLEQATASAAVLGVPLTACFGRWRSLTVLEGDLRLMYWVLAMAVLGGILIGAIESSLDSRAGGLFANPNSFASIAVMPFGLGVGLYGLARVRFVYAVVQMMLATVILTTGSRTGIVALAFCVIWPMLRRSRMSNEALKSFLSLMLGTAVVLTVVGVWQPGMIDHIGGRFDPSTERTLSYLSAREDTWHVALGLWVESPIVGHGYRAGEVLFDQRRGGDTFGHLKVETAHNGFIQVLLETGLVGLGLLIAALVVVIRARPPSGELSRRLWIAASTTFGAGLATQWTRSSILGLGSVFSFSFWTVACVCAVLALRDHAVDKKNARHDLPPY
jgi:O-antigen ligase